MQFALDSTIYSGKRTATGDVKLLSQKHGTLQLRASFTKMLLRRSRSMRARSPCVCTRAQHHSNSMWLHAESRAGAKRVCALARRTYARKASLAGTQCCTRAARCAGTRFSSMPAQASGQAARGARGRGERGGGQRPQAPLPTLVLRLAPGKAITAPSRP